jgi:hypothetical protein
MAPTQLLAWLKTLNIEIADDKTYPDGTRVVTLSAQLPFPNTRRVWYPLVLMPNQPDVKDQEVEALLRHCWHAEQEIPKVPPNPTVAGTTPPAGQPAAPKSNGPTSTAMNPVKRVKAS